MESDVAYQAGVLIGALILWAICGGAGAWVATQKGRSPAEGVVLGGLFGPLGVLIEALLPTLQRKASRGGGGVVGAAEVFRPTVDQQGVAAFIADRYRTVIDGTGEGWAKLTFREKQAALKAADPGIRKELKMTPTAYADCAAPARRLVLGR